MQLFSWHFPNVMKTLHHCDEEGIVLCDNPSVIL